MTTHTVAILPALLRVEAAADYVGISRATIYDMIKGGRIEAISFEGRRVIVRESLDRLVAEARAQEPVTLRPSPNPKAKPARVAA